MGESRSQNGIRSRRTESGVKKRRVRNSIHRRCRHTSGEACARHLALRELRLSETRTAILVSTDLASRSRNLWGPLGRNFSRTLCHWPAVEERVLASAVAEKNRPGHRATDRCTIGQQRIDAANARGTCPWARCHSSPRPIRLRRTGHRLCAITGARQSSLGHWRWNGVHRALAQLLSANDRRDSLERSAAKSGRPWRNGKFQSSAAPPEVGCYSIRIL